MKLTKVSVTYGELRSTGYPSFSNTRHEIMLEAEIQATDSPARVKDALMDMARTEVKKAFGDTDASDRLLPF